MRLSRILPASLSLSLVLSLAMLGGGCSSDTSTKPSSPSPLASVTAPKPKEAQVLKLGNLSWTLPAQWECSNVQAEIPEITLDVTRGLAGGYLTINTTLLSDWDINLEQRTEFLENYYEAVQNTLFGNETQVGAFHFDSSRKIEDLTLLGQPARLYPILMERGENKLPGSIYVCASETHNYFFILLTDPEKGVSRLPQMQADVQAFIESATVVQP